MFMWETARNCNWKERQTPGGQSASHSQCELDITVLTQNSGDRPTLHTEFFLIWMGVFSKIVFWPWDRRARQQAGSVLVLCSAIDCKLYLCKPFILLTHGIRRRGERQATLKTLSKNGKALFNFTNKIILKSLCHLFAYDLITAEYSRVKNHLCQDRRKIKAD